MYKPRKPQKSQLTSIETVEGQTLEMKVRKIKDNNEPITAEAPELYTERKDGVIAGYNIRTDRWELATESMDIVSKQKIARRESKAEEKKEVKEQLKKDAITDGKTESTQGTKE